MNEQTKDLCQECRQSAFQYQCPRCSFRSCSLACCQAHKQRTQCTGKRDRTAFVKVGEMTDATLQNDYHFLEDVIGRLDANQRFLRQSGGAKRQRRAEEHDTDAHILLQAARKQDGIAPKRLILPMQNGQASNSEPSDRTTGRGLSNLQNHARNRGVSLLCLPPFMERHKQNQTRIRNKNIFWTVEWRVYPDTGQAKSTTVHQISETAILWDELCQLVSNGDQRLAKHSFLLKNELSPANAPKYTLVSSSSTLANALMDQTIIEFPSIHIVPPCRLEEFPLSIQMIEDMKNAMNE